MNRIRLNSSSKSGRAQRKAREKKGRRAEFLAAQLLRLKGYKIISTRFKTKAGEIDLVAVKKDLIIFVEVKARTDLGAAREAISFESQNRIRKASKIFLGRKTDYQRMGVRYDAIFLLKGFRIIHETDFFR